MPTIHGGVALINDFPETTVLDEVQGLLIAMRDASARDLARTLFEREQYLIRYGEQKALNDALAALETARRKYHR